MKRILINAFCFFLLVSLSQAQIIYPRVPILLGPGSQSLVDYDLRTDGDRVMAMTITNNFPSSLQTYDSDGRGVLWSGPSQVSTNLRLFAKTPLHLAGSEAYAFWISDPNGVRGEEAFFDVSPSVGSPWGLDRLIPTGFGTGVGQVNALDADVVEDGVEDDLFCLVSFDPTAAGGADLLLMSVSLDAGLTFLPTTSVSSTNGSGTQPTDARVLVNGDTVHVIWLDERTGTGDLYYQRSADSGATWLPCDLQLDSTGFGLGDVLELVQVATQGCSLSVAFREVPEGGGNTELRVTTSLDNGLTFLPDARVFPGLDVAQSIGTSWVGYLDDELLALVWSCTDSEIQLSRSVDGGQLWSTPSTVAESGLMNDVSVAFRDEEMYVTWVQTFTVSSTFSIDGGQSWAPDFALSHFFANVDEVSTVVPDSYRNVIGIWNDDLFGAPELGNNVANIGGYRPQQVRLTELIGGAGTSRLRYTNFEQVDTLASTLVSLTPGSFILSDGRDLGIAFDDLFQYSIGDGLAVFSAMLDSNGEGDSSTFPTPPAGSVFNLVGISFDLTNGLSLGDITDVLSVTIGN